MARASGRGEPGGLQHQTLAVAPHGSSWSSPKTTTSASWARRGRRRARWASRSRRRRARGCGGSRGWGSRGRGTRRRDSGARRTGCRGRTGRTGGTATRRRRAGARGRGRGRGGAYAWDGASQRPPWCPEPRPGPAPGAGRPRAGGDPCRRGHLRSPAATLVAMPEAPGPSVPPPRPPRGDSPTSRGSASPGTAAEAAPTAASRG